MDLVGSGATPGSSSLGATLNNTGTVEASGGIGTFAFASLSGTGTLEANGATLIVAGSLAGTSTQNIITNSASSVFETTGNLFFGDNLNVSFLGPNGEFEYNDPTSDSHIIFSLSGLNAGASATTPTNFFDLGNETVTISSGGTGNGATGEIVMSNGDTLALSGITGFGTAGWTANAQSDGSGGTEVFLNSNVTCYCRGTLILTKRGEVPVEDLAIGDEVVTVSGTMRPITWMGRRKVAARFCDPLRAWPVRIKADALADCVPSRDLLVSPDHAILVDDILIQAGALVNGFSIVREIDVPDTFTYYHVELDDHSLILAEGTPAETFVDNVDRMAFDNWDEYEALYPEGKSVAEMPYPRAKSHRQVPRCIRERIAARKDVSGWKAPIAA